MNQTTLDNNGKRILDATCSYARVWPKHATIRIDIRPEVNPDYTMDAKNLTFEDESFDEIYCDPPHLFRKGEHKTESIKRRLTGRKSPGFWQRYGYWNSKEDWIEFVTKTNESFARVLTDNGLLHYKITESSSSITLKDLVTRMDNFNLISDTQKDSNSNLGTGNVHYLTFEKRTTDEQIFDREMESRSEKY